MKSRLNRWLAKSALMVPRIFAGTAEAQFGNVYGFGDSLTDNGRPAREPETGGPLSPGAVNGYGPAPWANGQTWIELFPSLVGGSFAAENDFAIGGATTSGTRVDLLAQVDDFDARVNPGPRDIAGVWIGINNFWSGIYGGSINAENYRTSVAAAVDDVRVGLTHLRESGIRNVVLVDVFDMARVSPENFPRDLGGGPPGPVNEAYPATATLATTDYNNQLKELAVPGLNVFYVDNLALMEQVVSRPDLYGITRVDSADSCVANGCASLSQSAQDEFLFMDFIHVSAAYQEILGSYAANIVNARSTLGVQGALGEAAGERFSETLFGHLDAYRNAGIEEGRLSVFVEGHHAEMSEDGTRAWRGPDMPGHDPDLSGLTVGAEYRYANGFSLGAALNYFSGDSDLHGFGASKTDMDSTQIGLFASFNDGNLFFDGAATYGFNSYDFDRYGVVDTLGASTDGNTSTVAARAGYLFDMGPMQLGPVTELRYVHTSIDGYTESGDPVLTMGVKKQRFEHASGGVGLQLRGDFSVAHVQLSPFVTLTANTDFSDENREVTSFQTSAPAHEVRTSAGRRGEDSVYGRLAGGMRADIGSNFSATLGTASTLGNEQRESLIVTGGVSYRF